MLLFLCLLYLTARMNYFMEAWQCHLELDNFCCFPQIRGATEYVGLRAVLGAAKVPLLADLEHLERQLGAGFEQPERPFKHIWSSQRERSQQMSTRFTSHANISIY